MLGKIVSGLRGKLIVVLAVFSLVQILALGYLSFTRAKTGLEKAEFNKLYSERELRKEELVSYLRGTMQAVRFMAQTESVGSAVDTLNSYHKYHRAAPDAPFDVTSPLYKKWARKIDPFFRSFMETHPSEFSGYQDILILDAHDGNIMYTSKHLKDLGANVNKGDLKGSGLGRLWARIMKSAKPATVDFSQYGPSGEAAAFAGVPVREDDGVVKGVLVLRLGAQKINRIFGDSAKEVETRKAYLVGQDYLSRSQSGVEGGGVPIGTRVDTEATRKALAGESGTGIMEGHTGKTVLSSYSDVGLESEEELGADFKWVVVAEVDTGEAFQPVQTLKTHIGFIAGGIALISILIAILLSNTLAKPLMDLSRKVAEVGKGDLTIQIPWLNRNDEIGTLAKAVHSMLTDLRNQTRQLLEGVEVVASSASEISATASQLSVTTSKTSTAMTETTATVQQVKQSASTANEKAKNVADTAHQAAEISRSGLNATRETIEGMNIIKGQMETIGDTVVKLRDQSEAIENIIATVQDLADQSNLLAVNASIEAARAGDYGKGFTVVAHEIKTLAEQSRESTERIRKILQDTRQWVKAVVLAAEEGGKAVEAGVAKSMLAGETIEALVEGVTSSVHAASVIETSSLQQAQGVDQVASAMLDIENSLRQNTEGASQLESAADKLQDLGEQLRKSVGHYRV